MWLYLGGGYLWGNTASPVSSAHVILSTGDSFDLSQVAGSHNLLSSVFLGVGI